MKKTLLKNISALMLLGVLGVSTTVKADDPAFDKGSNTIGISIGIGRPYDGFGFVAPAFGVIYDHGFFGDIGPGTIGIGGVVAIKTSSDSYLGGYSARLTNYIFAVRGDYHLTILKDKNNKFDPYAGVTLGVRINQYSGTYYDYYYSTYHSYLYNHHGVDPVAGVFVGAKYNFTPFFGAFAEVSYDISNIRGGVNFNFGK